MCAKPEGLLCEGTWVLWAAATICSAIGSSSRLSHSWKYSQREVSVIALALDAAGAEERRKGMRRRGEMEKQERADDSSNCHARF